MCFSGSVLVMRLISLLPATLPGTMIPSFANAPSRVSKWNSVSRLVSSGPWQAKQLFERIGRMSRLKPTGGAACPAARAARLVAAASARHSEQAASRHARVPR